MPCCTTSRGGPTPTRRTCCKRLAPRTRSTANSRRWARASPPAPRASRGVARVALTVAGGLRALAHGAARRRFWEALVEPNRPDGVDLFFHVAVSDDAARAADELAGLAALLRLADAPPDADARGGGGRVAVRGVVVESESGARARDAVVADVAARAGARAAAWLRERGSACVDDEAAAATMAAGYGMANAGCADLADWCAMGVNAVCCATCS